MDEALNVILASGPVMGDLADMQLSLFLGYDLTDRYGPWDMLQGDMQAAYRVSVMANDCMTVGWKLRILG